MKVRGVRESYGLCCLVSLPILLLAIAGCAAAPVATPTAMPVAATVDVAFVAQGGGEPRGAGYWLLWNSCAPDNRAEMAAANGGRQAGWILMDDLLADPGILMGQERVASCEQGLAFLQGTSVDANDAGAVLAAQLLAAQLNLAVGAESCPAAAQAMQAAQLLLIAAEPGGEMGQPGSEEAAVAQELAAQLATYNRGELCR